MTVLEAIQANPILANVPEKYIETVLISRSVTGSAIYTESSLENLELVTADLYVAIATLPEFKEGQLSLKYNSRFLEKLAFNLFDKYGDPKADQLKPVPIDVRVRRADV